MIDGNCATSTVFAVCTGISFSITMPDHKINYSSRNYDWQNPALEKLTIFRHLNNTIQQTVYPDPTEVTKTNIQRILWSNKSLEEVPA